ncbi:glycoside hydrolase family 3 N-terminal domain-containing protein [Leptospira stimsonii]|uniref:beta-N-acetylhexosaminidase n=1 Tax=Leptospira stimsonii TaxID=2202203 RepID=A0A396Z1Q1_9LEPT|nr:glycoside hydrolase family 3 N-terminal domain-containing protein [Leptospira stimsonii]RHX89392.1 glycosyl hydrolase family 3 [Leptospira stimsonii]
MFILRITNFSCFLLSVGFFAITFLIRDPLLLKVRSVSLWIVFSTTFLFTLFFSSLVKKNRDRFVRILLFLSLLFVWAGAANSVYKELIFQTRKKAVLNSDPKLLKKFAEHILVGYRNDEDLENYLKIPFAGFFLTSHNLSGMNVETLKGKIEKIQKIRKDLGFPIALISSDQEGGIVSRLSPPLKRPASLLELYKMFPIDSDSKTKMRRAIFEKAKDLRYVGVNFNFSPVADLMEKNSNPLDFFSQIQTRAISNDPEVVSELVRMYCEVMIENRILPTLKHFPGIGTVTEDTHFFNGNVRRTTAEMKNKDLVPFIDSMKEQKTIAVMLSHSFWKGLDSQNPVSLSKAVITDFLRKEGSKSAILITDDLNMFPVYYRSGGIVQASADSLNAGTDLLLISYDGEQVYEVLYELIRLGSNDSIDKNLEQSNLRLKELQKFFGSR